MIYSKQFSVYPVSPFNFQLSARIFENGDNQIRVFRENIFHQVIRVDDDCALCSIESAGTVENPELRVELRSSVGLTQRKLGAAVASVTTMFNLDFDLKPFYKQVEKDLIMKCFVNKLFGLKSPSTQFAFEALVDSIVEQQISLKVANALERRMIKKWGTPLKLEETYFAYPTPESLVKATLEELRTIGLSERKASYISNVASLIAQKKLNLESLKFCKDTERIIEELDRLRGVGVWTAELTMLRGMRKLEAFPADDLGLRRTISRYYYGGKTITADKAREIAESWGAWKGLAAYYLIVADHLGLELEY